MSFKTKVKCLLGFHNYHLPHYGKYIGFDINGEPEVTEGIITKCRCCSFRKIKSIDKTLNK